MLATAGETWREGFPEQDWNAPIIDYHSIFPDERIIKPSVYFQPEIEWEVEETQRELLAKGGDR